jgi:hypothetical protein
MKLPNHKVIDFIGHRDEHVSHVVNAGMVWLEGRNNLDLLAWRHGRARWRKGKGAVKHECSSKSFTVDELDSVEIDRADTPASSDDGKSLKA